MDFRVGCKIPHSSAKLGVVVGEKIGEGISSGQVFPAPGVFGFDQAKLGGVFTTQKRYFLAI